KCCGWMFPHSFGLSARNCAETSIRSICRGDTLVPMSWVRSALLVCCLTCVSAQEPASISTEQAAERLASLKTGAELTALLREMKIAVSPALVKALHQRVEPLRQK